MSQRQLHLNLNFIGAGTHSGAWRWPGNRADAFLDPDYLVEVAKIAERGTFDAIFLPDRPAHPDRSGTGPFPALEPTLVLATIAAATRHIGLIATVSTSYNEPYNIARRIATLDHLSRGRAGVNLITSADLPSAANFGLDAVPEHAQRYRRAIEFAQVLQALWESWGEGALIADAQSGKFIEHDKVRPIHHEGEFFRVRGPLNLPRSPQDKPVLVQAGGSDDGLELAAAHAELVFTAAHTLDDAQAYATKLRQRAQALGRSPNAIAILPGLVTIIGSTEAEAREREAALWELSSLEQGLKWLGGILQVDASGFDLDQPLPAGIPVPVNGSTTFARNLLAKAYQPGVTLRQLLRTRGGGANNHRAIVGTPEQIADDIIEWFSSGAIDGFNLMPIILPSGLEDFVDHVVPILRHRGVFRHEYEGTTLRAHLGAPSI
ncbi:FMN-dependent oxidoreductase, nitrilotriacetate monooxygenase family [Lampropedia hyalina DSM 16112]|jgi:FMN-dependent oxidoreductase (nitrilotriacetate monooxygenase family)|uniref:FMN-dependent oxidoreductase, nitrilotriacetate monooxygenase family n=1 Tax=Lampropedia hyalina DSM 16112 TaxID=1122156 RepID=A0A1M4SNK5_9BURK|nr:LLM class flavin-dependent oxidoreductase [Lampropedia hyalina]SHE33810.1 FMN-dependent oxidoreductase, nitrilotriacetate monooxygenase family [Lampropedia hyalina DSM 16112]